jgi:hypothetical protein
MRTFFVVCRKISPPFDPLHRIMWNESKCESKLHAQVRREMKDPEMLSQVVYAFANVAVKMLARK